MNDFITLSETLTFEKWMREVMEFSERTIQSRLSNLAILEKYFGPLIDQWKKDRFESLLEKLSYTRADERDGITPNLQIPINGNIYFILATYRSVLRLYAKYLDAIAQLSILPFDHIGQKVDNAIQKVRQQYNGKKSYTQNEVKALIVEPLIASLQQELASDGYSISSEQIAETTVTNGKMYNDRYDISCESTLDLPKIIIEIDTHRSDQVTKKAVSRVALNADDRLLYIALVYPNTHVNRITEEKECMKYFSFLNTVFDLFKAPDKKFKGYTLY